MKIAQIAPLYEAVPPSLYGGTERIVAHLTNALVELGHDVTLFASAEAHTRATLVPVRDQAIRLDPFPLKSDLAAHLSMLHELHLRRHEFDLLQHILRGDQAIYLAGIDDAHYYRVDNIEKAASEIPDNGFSILLSHT